MLWLGMLRRQAAFLSTIRNQGWKPLCKFLDKPIPKEEFPTGNVAKFRNRIGGCIRPKAYPDIRNLVILLELKYMPVPNKGQTTSHCHGC